MKADLLRIFQVAIAVLIPLVSFTTGLRAPKPGGQSLLKQPALLIRALLAIAILVPLWVIVLLEALPLDQLTRTGILIAALAIGIGPVAGMKRMDPNTPKARFALELNIIVLALSIVFVPAAFAFVADLAHREVSLGAGQVAKVVLIKALLPLVIGLGLARLFPKYAPTVGRYLAKVEKILLLGIVLLALVVMWRQLLDVGAKGWLACVAAAVGAVLIGHLLGGPDSGHRGVVAAASAMRFPALALVLASVTQQPKQLLPVVVAYALSAAVVVSVYSAVTARKARRTGVPAQRRTGPAVTSGARA